MKKIILISSALVIAAVLIAGASDIQRISATDDVIQGDTLIYLSDDSSDQSLIFEKKQGLFTFHTTNSKPSKPPVESRIILDVPENDECVNALSIGDMQDQSITIIDATSDDLNIITAPNIWYLYTASTTGHVQIITEDIQDFSNSRTMFAVYEGSSCPEYESFPSPVEFQGGETIETAAQISDPLPVVYTGTTEGYSSDYDFSCKFTSAPDVVYSYVADTDDSIAVILSPLTTDYFYTTVQVMDDDGYVLACQNYANYYNYEIELPGQAIFNIPVEAGETYYIVVSGASYHYYDEGEYILKVFSPDYTVLHTFLDYEIDTPGFLFDAVAGQQYLIEIGYEGDDGDGLLTITSVPTPDNDECENATDAGVLQSNVPVQFTGSNTGAAISNCPWMNSDLPVRDVWIKFTIEDTTDIEIDYCGNTSISDMISMSSRLYKDCPCEYGSPVAGGTNPFRQIRNCPNMSPVMDWSAVPPGTYLYPMIVDYRYEGDYVINLTGVSVQRCSDNAVTGQIPTSRLDNDFVFTVSDYQAGYMVADDFDGVADSINQVSWWGLYSEPNDSSNACYPDSCPFRIIFCEYDDATPLLPGDTVEVYNVTASAEETGNGFFYPENPQVKLTAQLDRYLFLERGWIIIMDNGINDCYFWWQNSSYLGDGVQYDIISQQWSRVNIDLAFCLEFNDSLVAINDDPSSLPTDFALAQNYPNPFNAKTSIQFSLKEADEVTLDIYDIGGRLIKSLYDGNLTAGTHSLIWDGTNESGNVVSSGIYFYRLKTSNNTISKSMVLLK